MSPLKTKGSGDNPQTMGTKVQKGTKGGSPHQGVIRSV